ncbi:MAG: ABC transporter substrate-binding protein [Candidatus Heimdallarchaeota archaeon]|nr:ABC transporter substrate-binding protein [Candidatus Heimdallarchaeota archaeon]
MRKYSILVAWILLLGILPHPSSSTGDSQIVYALPYDMNEFTQFTATSYATYQWLSAMQVGLFSRASEKDRQFDLELAKAYSLSTDQHTFTVELKSDLKFSDGSKLSADDVIATYQALLDANFNLASYDYYESLLTSESIIKLDDNTISFTFNKPYIFALEALSAGIIPKSQIETLMNNPNKIDELRFSSTISAGPFRFLSEDISEKKVSFEKNPYYWNSANVKATYLTFQTIHERSAAIDALKTGVIDIMDSQFVPGQSVFENETEIKMELFADAVHHEMGYNHLHPYFGTGENLSVEDQLSGARKIRQAMSYAIDRDHIIDSYYRDIIPAATMVSPSTIGYDDTITYRKHSLETAKSLMQEAGFNYSTLEYIDNTYSTFFFNISLLAPNSFSSLPVKNLISPYLEKIGIGVKEVLMTGWEVIGPRSFASNGPPPIFDEGGFDVLFVGYGHALDFDPSRFYESTEMLPNGYNFYNYNNSDYDAMIEDYMSEMNFDIRIERFKDLQAFWFDEEIITPLYHSLSILSYNKELDGIDPILFSLSHAEWDKIHYPFMLITSSNTTDSTYLSFLMLPLLVSLSRRKIIPQIPIE